MSSRNRPAPDSVPTVGDRFEGSGIPRAFACVIRRRDQDIELLVFDHPEAGTQIPKGRIRPGEKHRDAAARELAEESGLELEPRELIAHFEHSFSRPLTSAIVTEDWYVWLFEAPADSPESWIHEPDEEDMPFSYRWIAVDERTVEKVHSHFSRVVNLTQAFLRGVR